MSTPEEKKTTAPKSLYPSREASQPLEECAQCFYQPEEVKTPNEPEVDDCAQCFYQPPKEDK